MSDGASTSERNQRRDRASVSASRGRALPLIGACGLAAGLMGGCEVDSYMDPSVLGRWERTPTVMPIVEHLSAIEDQSPELVQTTPIQPQDLIADAQPYRYGPGDQLEISVRDFPSVGVTTPFPRAVDAQGFIDLPQLPPIRADGLTRTELIDAIERALRERRIIERGAVITIAELGKRQQTFSVLGAVANPTQYFIPAPNYRLLEAITAAGGINETLPYLYVIRQVPLSEAVTGRTAPAPQPEPTRLFDREPARPEREEPRGEDLIDLIEELGRPGDGAAPPSPPPPSPAPAEPAPVAPPAPGVLGALGGHRAQPAPERAEPRPEAPPIELPDTRTPSPSSEPTGGTDWRYVDGRWVRGAGGTPVPGADAGPALVTQRVIQVPIAPLLAGVADVNIVVRPGDVIRIPPPRSGLVYMTGQVARVGPYGLPVDGRLTLLRAITAAGGLGAIAYPERVDITRVIGEGRQATIRVNLRAIAEQTQPDIYLKPDDMVNVGTNFWMYPLAVFRGGLRASYGFGFLLDRNFAFDVFGPEQDFNR